MVGKNDFRVGDYAVLRDSVVLIDGEPAPGRFSVEYVSYYPKGVGITSGGFSSSWDASEFAPITDPGHLIRVRAYMALKSMKSAEAMAAKHKKDFEVHQAALAVFEDARAAVGGVAPELTEMVRKLVGVIDCCGLGEYKPHRAEELGYPYEPTTEGLQLAKARALVAKYTTAA